MWQDVLTAAVFYMPFVMTIGFALFVFLVGFVCLLSGTFFVLVLAAYGIYSLLRDSGVLSKAGDKMNGAWSFLNKTVLNNIKESFVLANPEQIPNKQALYICSPHGMVGYSWFFHLSYCLSPWPETSPRLFSRCIPSCSGFRLRVKFSLPIGVLKPPIRRFRRPLKKETLLQLS